MIARQCLVCSMRLMNWIMAKMSRHFRDLVKWSSIMKIRWKSLRKTLGHWIEQVYTLLFQLFFWIFMHFVVVFFGWAFFDHYFNHFVAYTFVVILTGTYICSQEYNCRSLAYCSDVVLTRISTADALCCSDRYGTPMYLSCLLHGILVTSFLI